jgi:hypothetical protein
VCEHTFVFEPKPQPAAAAFSLWADAAFKQLEFPMEASPNLLTPDEELLGEHGEVFTRRWVVELILDLVGYTADKDLASQRAVEPACGSGAFLVPMVERLAQSAKLHDRDLLDATEAIFAIDLLTANVVSSRSAVIEVLCRTELGMDTATRLAHQWVHQGDYLLQPTTSSSADFVVGNPPYVRLEAIPEERSSAYRRNCQTMGGRADLYIGFYEQGLRALSDGGSLGFICADRWMRNAYGSNLRELISTEWSVDLLLSLTGVDAFEEEVDAYPAVTVISRREQTTGPIVIEGARDLGPAQAKEISALTDLGPLDTRVGTSFSAARLPSWFKGRSGWPNGHPERLATIAELEAKFPTLEDVATGTKVGIGVATGADKVFIVNDPRLVEPERLLPLALPRDISSGSVEWSGKYLVNPWDAQGLVELSRWPRMAAYLQAHEGRLSARHTARRGQWHKTIDRVIEGLGDRPKLYLPDFKEAIFPVLDNGDTYPQHNLYWVTSDKWDLNVLGGLLLSDVANLFIEAYSVRMRGGYLRFQAQYLRRIRLPFLQDVTPDAARELAEAFQERNRDAATTAALPLYGLTELPQ